MTLQKFLSIRAKLFSSFGVVLLLMLVVGILGITKVDAVGANADTVGQNSLPSMVAVKTIDGLSMDYRGVQFTYVAAVKKLPADVSQVLHAEALKRTATSRPQRGQG